MAVSPTGEGSDLPPGHEVEQVDFDHQPVMASEVVELASQLSAGIFLDATIGGGGHAEAVLAENQGLTVLGLDQDPFAVSSTRSRLGSYGDRVVIEQVRFDQLQSVLDRTAGTASGDDDGRSMVLQGFLFDLGVSSPQLDRSERGFSFRNDGPLDMRMDTTQDLTADEVVNSYSVEELRSILRRNADERFAHRIAEAIVAARPLRSTSELADVVAGAIPAPARRSGGHPARRSFQAIRIEVNSG